jgi:hypothetical protein
MIKRGKVYASDWSDGFNNLRKVIPAILFLYFACLSPAISFGTIASQLTNNSIGVVEFLLSAGASGMVGFIFEISHYRGNQKFSYYLSCLSRRMLFSVGSPWHSSLPLA